MSFCGTSFSRAVHVHEHMHYPPYIHDTGNNAKVHFYRKCTKQNRPD